MGRGGGVYDAVASGTAVPAPSLLAASTCCCVLVRIGSFGAQETVTESSCVMPRCLAQPFPLSVYDLPAHAVVYGLCPLVITFEVARGVELYDAAMAGTAVPALRLRSPCTRCCVRIALS